MNAPPHDHAMADPEIEIESLDLEARGIGHVDGKVVFVEGALPQERVRFSSFRRKSSYELAVTTDILRPSAVRVEPRCAYFGQCGGCSMQHLEPRAQVAIKQRILEDNLWHIGRVRAESIYRPTHGPNWGYRLRARLAVRSVRNKGVLVGFHERKRSFITDMKSCDIVPPHVSALLVPLRTLIAALSICERIPQIELAVGAQVTVLVVRVLSEPTASDRVLLSEFAAAHQIEFWLQPRGTDSARPMSDGGKPLWYDVSEFGIRMPFRPTDFTQVNHDINRILIRRVMQLLAPASGDRIVDFFCGLGNFTLPLATRAREVVGVEGNEALIQRARENAVSNGLNAKASFVMANLFLANSEFLATLGAFDKALIDPPREGAIQLVRILAALGSAAPTKIVYVSCNPATLARDAAILNGEGGYRLTGAGVVNMFPHTSHVESVALFEKKETNGARDNPDLGS